MEKDNSMNQQENDKAEVMLQMIKVEYGAMREEINNTHSHIFMTIEISSATITALLAFLLNLQVNSFMFHFFLIVVIPWICASSTLIILSESQRMKRAGNYICILEEKVKNLCNYENESGSEGEKSWRLTQEKIEKWLKMCPSRISLLEPLCFERWIRELEAVNSPLGRANFLLIFRFALIYGGASALSLFSSLVMWFRDARSASWNILYAIFFLATVIGLSAVFYLSMTIIANESPCKLLGKIFRTIGKIFRTILKKLILMVSSKGTFE